MAWRLDVGTANRSSLTTKPHIGHSIRGIGSRNRDRRTHEPPSHGTRSGHLSGGGQDAFAPGSVRQAVLDRELDAPVTKALGGDSDLKGELGFSLRFPRSLRIGRGRGSLRVRRPTHCCAPRGLSNVDGYLLSWIDGQRLTGLHNDSDPGDLLALLARATRPLSRVVIQLRTIERGVQTPHIALVIGEQSLLARCPGRAA